MSCLTGSQPPFCSEISAGNHYCPSDGPSSASLEVFGKSFHCRGPDGGCRGVDGDHACVPVLSPLSVGQTHSHLAKM
jgi:hypothetical protein